MAQYTLPLFSAPHSMCRKFFTYMKNDLPVDVAAPSLNTKTSNYLCCAIMLKASPSFLVLQLQVAFSTDSNFKSLEHKKAINLITKAKNLLKVTRPYPTQIWEQEMNSL